MSINTEIANKQINITPVTPNIFMLHHPPFLVSIVGGEVIPHLNLMHNLNFKRKNMRKRQGKVFVYAFIF